MIPMPPTPDNSSSSNVPPDDSILSLDNLRPRFIPANARTDYEALKWELEDYRRAKLLYFDRENRFIEKKYLYSEDPKHTTIKVARRKLAAEIDLAIRTKLKLARKFLGTSRSNVPQPKRTLVFAGDSSIRIE